VGEVTLEGGEGERVGIYGIDRGAKNGERVGSELREDVVQ
jgi:hypothetical protein